MSAVDVGGPSAAIIDDELCMILHAGRRARGPAGRPTADVQLQVQERARDRSSQNFGGIWPLARNSLIFKHFRAFARANNWPLFQISGNLKHLVTKHGAFAEACLTCCISGGSKIVKVNHRTSRKQNGGQLRIQRSIK